MEHCAHTTRKSSIYKKANNERAKDENVTHTENEWVHGKNKVSLSIITLNENRLKSPTKAELDRMDKNIYLYAVYERPTLIQRRSVVEN